jgi:NADPH:quinone reductase-like Zn-dependent oxidoreductase
MKAVVCEKYGPPEVLKITEVPTPLPGDGDIRVKVNAVEVTSGDHRIRAADVPGVFKPFFYLAMGISGPRSKILGGSFAGVVDAVGKDVTGFSPGDRVMASTYETGFGGYAEYAVLPENGVVGKIPEGLSFTQAAGLFFGGHAALHFLRKAGIGEDQDVLIYGASGAVGTFAVQLAHYFGARVTGVAGPDSQELVAALGASRVIDYTQEDFTWSGEKYDIIFDTVGKSPWAGSLKALKEGGRYPRTVHLDPGVVLKGIWAGLTSSKKVIGGVAGEKAEDIEFLADLAQKGEIKATIDRTYPLDEIVEAHRYVDGGHKRGSVVVEVG